MIRRKRGVLREARKLWSWRESWWRGMTDISRGTPGTPPPSTARPSNWSTNTHSRSDISQHWAVGQRQPEPLLFTSGYKRYHSVVGCLSEFLLQEISYNVRMPHVHFWIWKISTRRAVSLNTFCVHLNVRLTYFDFSVFQQLNIEKVHVVTTKYACGITSISTGIHKVLVGYKCMSLSLSHYFALMFSPSLHVPFVYRWLWKVLTSSMIFVADIQKLSFLLHIMD